MGHHRKCSNTSRVYYLAMPPGQACGYTIHKYQSGAMKQSGFLQGPLVWPLVFIHLYSSFTDRAAQAVGVEAIG